jgi:hypothetical protein
MHVPLNKKLIFFTFVIVSNFPRRRRRSGSLGSPRRTPSPPCPPRALLTCTRRRALRTTSPSLQSPVVRLSVLQRAAPATRREPPSDPSAAPTCGPTSSSLPLLPVLLPRLLYPPLFQLLLPLWLVCKSEKETRRRQRRMQLQVGSRALLHCSKRSKCSTASASWAWPMTWTSRSWRSTRRGQVRGGGFILVICTLEE